MLQQPTAPVTTIHLATRSAAIRESVHWFKPQTQILQLNTPSKSTTLALNYLENKKEV